MKKLYILLLAISVLPVISNHTIAQGIYQTWGVTRYGAEEDQGVLFSAKFDGTGLKKREAFKITIPSGGNWYYRSVTINNKIYGFMGSSGLEFRSAIVEIDVLTGKYTKKLELASVGVSSNEGFYYVYNEKAFGIAIHQGVRKLYSYDPQTNTVIFIMQTNIVLDYITWYDNRYYCIDNAEAESRFYTFDPATYAYTQVFTVADKYGDIRGFQPYNNKLYSVSEKGGQFVAGCIIEFDPVTKVGIEGASLSPTGGIGPNSKLSMVNGKMYGTTKEGGVANTGILYEYNPANNTITKKLDITNTTVISNFLATINNKLYGILKEGGVNKTGQIFEYDPAANDYSVKTTFSTNSGFQPMEVMLVNNNRIYGFTYYGGAYDGGTVFEYNPANNFLSAKLSLGENNGYNPFGKLLYYQGKLYGFTADGGKTNDGVIYSYDVATHTYEVKQHMRISTGFGHANSGMVLFNNKFYGVTFRSEPGAGVIFEFDPATNAYLVKHQFALATGGAPVGRMVLFNNKFYGTATEGGNSNSGVLYEYDPVANTYAVKVHFSEGFGTKPFAGLTVYKDKLYGTCSEGGSNGAGTIFEYNPGSNGFSVKHHFVPVQGRISTSAMVVHKDKFYGTCDNSDEIGVLGILFEYNPAAGTVVTKHKFSYPEGSMPKNELHVYNNKLYGLTAGGGGVTMYGGVLYEFDLALNKWTPKSVLTGENGRFPFYSGLTMAPAPVAPGNPGSCKAANAALVNTTNATEWIPFTDEEGNAVMEINPNGNILGSVRVSFYTHNGETRKDGSNRFYLDRNITVSVEHQPTTAVGVRLYIKNSEFEKLKNTPGSGVADLSDITLFKNTDDCSDKVNAPATPIAAFPSPWGTDHVYIAEVSSFSSFYFASTKYTALPVKLEYFKGNAEAGLNRLHWKASCTENTDFIVERSADGSQFNQIGMVLATVEDCNKPFMFPDQQPLSGKNFYRLQMKEQSGAITYSSIISIDRSSASQLQITLANNPVQGSTANFMVQSPSQMILPVMVYDATGRMVLRSQWQVGKGSQQKQLELPQLPKGVYTVVFQAREKISPVRFIKQ